MLFSVLRWLDLETEDLNLYVNYGHFLWIFTLYLLLESQGLETILPIVGMGRKVAPGSLINRWTSSGVNIDLGLQRVKGGVGVGWGAFGNCMLLYHAVFHKNPSPFFFGFACSAVSAIKFVIKKKGIGEQRPVSLSLPSWE